VSNPLRLLFLGNSQSAFSNRLFAPLLDAPCLVAGVVDVPPEKQQSTNPWSSRELPSFIESARKRHIPVFAPTDPNSPDFVLTLAELKPDLFLAVGYMFLLKPPLLSVPTIAAVNFHASLLPAYRGKHPVFWALRSGEKEVGLTAHIMDPHLDTGDILYEVRVRTLRNDTVSSAYDRIILKSIPLVTRLVLDASQGTLPCRKQTQENASYFSSIQEEHLRLDWSLPAETLRRWITISPGDCWAVIQGTLCRFPEAETARTQSPKKPGEVVRIGRKYVTIAAGCDLLQVRTVKVEGRGILPLASLLKEKGIRAGDCL
jgi:methionyl-tRNA formyltransferase